MKMSETHRKLKISLWIVGIIIVLTLIATVTLAIMARRAVSDYRGGATTQLNDVIDGKTSGTPVQLNNIFFGETLSGDYKRVKSLDADYKELLNDTKSYVAVLEVHDALVNQYNAGIKGDKPISGELLKTVNKYKAVIENYFPNEKDRVKAIGDLSAKITSTPNTDFDAVSIDIDTVISNDDQFLAGLREKLNVRITEFQKKVN